MIGWALDKVDIPTRSILNEQGAVIGSFRPEHIQVMYKLSPNYRHTFNAEFLAEFQRKECIEAGQTYPDMIRGWARSEKSLGLISWDLCHSFLKRIYGLCSHDVM
jgi:hypothetical protein